MIRRNNPVSASIQRRVERPAVKTESKEYDGSSDVVSTGSTLLDLAISGGRFRRGGIPGGIFVEIFGPSSSGKTVLLCEIAGAVQRKGGDILFSDPEGRLNKQFASMFDFDIDRVEYSQPNTIPEVFEPIRSWKPKHSGINGIFADSLAALSTNLEMNEDDGDKMGMRRAKEFSEQLRKTCRVIAENNYLMVCSNQVRQNLDAGKYGQKWVAPGGQAVPFYASLRLRCMGSEKIKRTRTIAKKEHTRIIGIETMVEVSKSSVWEPYRQAPIYVIFDYGIDDIRGNLSFVKSTRGLTRYQIGDEIMGQSLEDAIAGVDGKENLIKALKKETIELWREVDEKFRVPRQPKRRDD